MDRRYVLAALLLTLVAGAVVSVLVQGPVAHRSALTQWTWNGFLFVLPLILAVITLTGARWSFMVAVLYGTIGLALDISTIVQEFLRAQTVSTAVWLSALTGLLNAALIGIGGNGFLDLDRASSLRAAPPPSRRSPSSAE
jgi:ABC-type multidrug transport system permease subunit